MSNEFENNNPENQEQTPNQSDSENVTNAKEESKEYSTVILEELTPSEERGVSLEHIEKLSDVEVPVRVLFARLQKTFEEVLSYCEGDVIRLNRFAGELVDVMVGDRILAKGEITVVDDNFGVRIVEILPSGDRLVPSIED